MERAARNGADPASAWAAVKGRAGEIPDHERARLRFVGLPVLRPGDRRLAFEEQPVTTAAAS